MDEGNSFALNKEAFCLAAAATEAVEVLAAVVVVVEVAAEPLLCENVFYKLFSQFLRAS